MAAVNYTRGVKLLIKVSQGGSPETFAALCTVNADRGITFNAQTNDANIIDCLNPDALAWLSREKQSLSIDVTGGGMSHKNDVKKLWDWWEGEESKNCQIILDDDDTDNIVTFEGLFHLTQFDLTGTRGEKVQSTLTLSSDGEVTATFGSNVSA